MEIFSEYNYCLLNDNIFMMQDLSNQFLCIILSEKENDENTRLHICQNMQCHFQDGKLHLLYIYFVQNKMDAT